MGKLRIAEKQEKESETVSGERKKHRGGAQKSGEKRIITTVYNYCNNKLFTLCDQFLLGNVTRGKDGNCCPKNNAD